MTDEPNELEDVAPGLKAARNDAGQFVKGQYHMTSERAREMSAGASAKTRQQQKADVDDLLRDSGVNPDDAPEHLKALAKIAASGKSGAVGALRDLRRLLSLDTPTQAQGTGTVAGGASRRPQKGEICPCCLRYVTLDSETAQVLLDTIRAVREHRASLIGTLPPPSITAPLIPDLGEP